MQLHLPRLHLHFVNYNMQVEMFATDWIIGLFCSTVPLGKLAHFFDKFFEEGWKYFYKVVIAFLNEIEKELLQEDEMCEILNSLKKNSRKWKGEESTAGSIMKKFMDAFTETSVWDRILRKANQYNLESPNKR